MKLELTRQAAILEQQLPFGTLHFQGAALRLRSRLLARVREWTRRYAVIRQLCYELSDCGGSRR